MEWKPISTAPIETVLIGRESVVMTDIHAAFKGNNGEWFLCRPYGYH